MTHTDIAIDWAERVVARSEDRCLYVRQACQRFLDDLERGDFPYYYDLDEAEWRCNWIQEIPHVKGRWAANGEKFVLSPWQAFTVCNLFGWRERETKLRRFLEVYLELPRKNGKSFKAAAIASTLFCEGEFGAEAYTGATTERQAWEVFRPAREIFLRNEQMREHYGVQVNAKSMTIAETGARFEPLIGDPGDGSSPSVAIIDEFHEHRNSELIDTMRTGMGAREEPLLFIITTAGVDFGGPCREKRGDVIAILDQQVADENTFGMIFTIDEGDRWDCEESLRKANPNWGISINPRTVLRQMDLARRSATAQAAFKTKQLNMWVGAKAVWMNMLGLQRCVARELKAEDFAGAKAYIAVDLASKKDLASIAVMVPQAGKMYAFNKYYLPHEQIYGDEADPRYRQWADAGLLEATDGRTIDYDRIEQDVLEYHKMFQIDAVAYDPWNATQFAQRLEKEGLTMVEVRPVVRNFSEPMKELEALTINRNYQYDGSAVTTWCFGNVVAKADKNDNLFPDKEKPENKIDGVVAQLMAYALYIGSRAEASPYESRGMREL